MSFGHTDTALDRVRDMKPTLDKALADIHALRDILGVPDGGNLVDHADALVKRRQEERAENASLRAQSAWLWWTR